MLASRWLQGGRPLAPEAKLVFVVDDSESVRGAVSALLGQAGYAPRAVESGEACLAALDTERPYAIFLDLGMAPMRGDECCRRIKESPWLREIPVVMMTAADAPHEVMSCWRAAADDFLPKPV